ncbi:MAG: rhomboid family intramembrane serine protease [Akkermansiaceae bacterium]
MSFFEKDRQGRRPFRDHDVTDLPMVTILSIVACLSYFWAFGMNDGSSIPNELAKVWTQDSVEIWKGSYWTLVTSVFVHERLFHILFNLYWLWIFGAAFERAVGSAKFFGFVVVSGFVSSSYQLAFSDNAGIGFSGVNYAFFGFMWVTRYYFSSFRGVLSDGVINLMFIWLFACIAISYLGILPIGNAAHFSGFLFGWAVGAIYIIHKKKDLIIPGFVVFMALSVVTLFWCPWSLRWSAMKAYDAHEAGRYEEALHHYDRIIRWHDDGWAKSNRQILLLEMDVQKKLEGE